jgi:TfoX/Sxy family transcriptional regulator of competence genes
MPDDLNLEKRLDRMAPDLGDFAKRKMFGGSGYMLNGNMAFGIHKDFLIIRVSPEISGSLLKQKFVSPFEMTRKPMAGWLQVAPPGVEEDSQLSTFLTQAVEYTKTLPKK